MIRIYDTWKCYSLTTIKGTGYICEVGENTYSYDSNTMILVFEKSYLHDMDIKSLANEPYYITQSFQPLEKAMIGIAKANEKTREGYIINYSFLDMSDKEIKKQISYMNFIGNINRFIDVKLPARYRKCDFNFIKNSYSWLTMTEDHMDVKSHRSVKEILGYPPFLHSIEICLQWWSEGITINNWNDSYCKKVVVCKKYINDIGDNTNRASFREVVDAISGQSCDCHVNNKVESVLISFEYDLLRINTEERAVVLLKKLYKDLEMIQEQNNFIIDTYIREVLMSYIHNKLSSIDMNNAIDACEKYRNW